MYEKHISSILALCFLLIPPVYPQNKEFNKPAQNHLRAMAVRESPRQTRILQIGKSIELPAGVSRHLAVGSADKLWLPQLSVSDPEFQDTMYKLRHELNDCFFTVISDERGGVKERFKKRYEAGGIAIANPKTYRGLADYKYDENFGIFKDIRQDAADFVNRLGITNAQAANKFLLIINTMENGTIGNQGNFKAYIMAQLQSLGIPAPEGLDWEALRDIARRIRPWLDMYLNLKPYEEKFIQRGRGDSDTFWYLLVKCKLKRVNFDSDAEYNAFISFLFRWKFSVGEVNEIYFSDITEEEAKKDRRLEAQREEEIAAVRKMFAQRAQKVLNRYYGIKEGNVLPLSILELFGLPHPVFHWEADRDMHIIHVYDPLNHILRAAASMSTHSFRNRRCLRLAILLHDISKVERKQNTATHPERSAKMTESALKDWGLFSKLSNEEVALARLLVDTHADFYLISEGGPGKPILDIASRLSPQRAGFECLSPWVSQETLLRMHRRVAFTDVMSIPGIARQDIPLGKMSQEELKKGAEALVVSLLKTPHRRIISELLRDEYKTYRNKAREGTPITGETGCIGPIFEWLDNMMPDERQRFFGFVSWALSDMTVVYPDFENTVLNGPDLQKTPNEIIRVFAQVDPMIKACGHEQIEAIKIFLKRAYSRFVTSEEKELPSVEESMALARKTASGNFYSDLNTFLGQFDLTQEAVDVVNQIDEQLRSGIEKTLQEHLGGGVTVTPTGSAVRGTYVVRRDPFVRYVDVDFDFFAACPTDLNLPDMQTMQHGIPRFLCMDMNKASQYTRVRDFYEGPLNIDYIESMKDPEISDTFTIHITVNGRRFVDIRVSKHPDRGAAEYNRIFKENLDSLNPADRQGYLRNVRMLKYFIRKQLGIQKSRRTYFGRADVVEQLVRQSGGTFETAMDFIHTVYFDEAGNPRSDQEIRQGLVLKSIVDQGEPKGNLLYASTPQQWDALKEELKKIAVASERFARCRQRNENWNLEFIAGMTTMPGRPAGSRRFHPQPERLRALPIHADIDMEILAAI